MKTESKEVHCIHHCGDCPCFLPGAFAKAYGTCKRFGWQDVEADKIPPRCPVARGERVTQLVIVEHATLQPAAKPASAKPKRDVPKTPVRFHGKTEYPPCPACDAPMRLRQRRRDGAPFLGCSTYPDCGGCRPIEDPRRGNEDRFDYDEVEDEHMRRIYGDD